MLRKSFDYLSDQNRARSPFISRDCPFTGMDRSERKRIGSEEEDARSRVVLQGLELGEFIREMTSERTSQANIGLIFSLPEKSLSAEIRLSVRFRGWNAGTG